MTALTIFEVNVYSPSSYQPGSDEDPLDNIIGVVSCEVLPSGALKISCLSADTYLFAQGVWGAAYAVRSQ